MTACSTPIGTSSSPTSSAISSSAGESTAAQGAIAAACSADKSPRIAEIQKRGELRWVLNLFSPLAVKRDDGTYVGTEPQHAAEFAEVLGVKPVVSDMSVDLMPGTVASGQADIAGSGIYITDERRKVVDFSDPYIAFGDVFVVLASRTDLNTIADLNKPDVKVVEPLGVAEVELAKTQLPNASHATGQENLVIPNIVSGEMTTSLRADIGRPLYELQAGSVKLKYIGVSGVITDYPAKGADQVAATNAGFAVQKGDPGFLDCLNAWVKDGVDSGRFDKQFRDWVLKFADEAK